MRARPRLALLLAATTMACVAGSPLTARADEPIPGEPPPAPAARRAPCRCRLPSGFYVGADAGTGMLLGVGPSPAVTAPSFGLQFGYRARSGLAFDVRWDDLGVPAPGTTTALQAGGPGLRYTLQGLVPLFAEAHVGAFVLPSSPTALPSAVSLPPPRSPPRWASASPSRWRAISRWTSARTTRSRTWTAPSVTSRR